MRALAAAAAAAGTVAAGPPPNFVFVLADDLDFDYKQDRKAVMPTLKKELADGGLEFHNHVAVYPVCGPSRSSMMAGRYPHNTRYVANGAVTSHQAWAKQQNDTIGTWMTKAGYHTAFLGKYVNGMECGGPDKQVAVPSGWSHWGGLTCTKNNKPYGVQGPLGGTYNYYNASQWQVDFDGAGQNPVSNVTIKIHTGVHQSEFLGAQAVEQIGKAVTAGKPFFVHVTPLMVHGGSCYGPQPNADYDVHDPWQEHHINDPDLDSKGKVKGTQVTGSPCPSTKHAWDFAGLKNPHLPSWNATPTGTVPQHMLQIGDTDKRGCCDGWEEERQHIVYRNRTSAVVDLDDMLATIFAGIDQHGVRGSTYVIFSADNGYHLGEHHLLFGKSHPYETDIRLPMYITGPGVPRGGRRAHPTTHLDITATIAAMAGAAQHSPLPLDGKSFAPALAADPPGVDAWRPFSYSEFYVGPNTWRNIRYINATTGEAEWTLHWWCSNQSEVYHTPSDAYQMANLGGDSPTPYGAGVEQRYVSATEVLGACSGAACSSLPAPGPAAMSLACGVIGAQAEVDEAWLDPDY